MNPRRVDPWPVSRGRARVLLVTAALFNVCVGLGAHAMVVGARGWVAAAFLGAFLVWGAGALAGSMKDGVPGRWSSAIHSARRAGWPPVPAALAYWACIGFGVLSVARMFWWGLVEN